MRYLDLLQSFFFAAGITTLLIQCGQKKYFRKMCDKSFNIKTFRRLEKQLPIFLDTVSSSLSSGSSLLQSLENAGKKTPPPLGMVIQRLITNVQTGMSLEGSLEKAADGAKSGTLLLVFHSMASSYRSGGNMVRSLSLLAELCRERQALQEKIQARTAQSRMQGTVLILVPFFFLILLSITSPGNLYPVLYSPLGRKVLLLAVALQSFGVLVIKRMLKQEILG